MPFAFYRWQEALMFQSKARVRLLTALSAHFPAFSLRWSHRSWCERSALPASSTAPPSATGISGGSSWAARSSRSAGVLWRVCTGSVMCPSSRVSCVSQVLLEARRLLMSSISLSSRSCLTLSQRQQVHTHTLIIFTHILLSMESNLLYFWVTKIVLFLSNLGSWFAKNITFFLIKQT